ncbi:AMIN domain-containing protein, partial [Hyella patelloides]|uniref:AMIN domain-containing protein n=1 Tax=Hyella patelloides TaxID=1982969 RepID=UPI0011A86B98
MKVFSVLLFRLLSVGSLLSLVLASPVGAETGSRGAEEQGCRGTGVQPFGFAQDKRCRSTAADLLAQVNLTRVTGIEINQTESGLEVILKTTAGSEKLVPLILPVGNDLVIDILDATLGFDLRDGVTELNPAPGIDRFELTKVDESSIRLTITGSSQTPSAEIVPSEQNLVLSVTPEQSTAQQQEDAPSEEIDIIVTSTTVGTRTETDLQDSRFAQFK